MRHALRHVLCLPNPSRIQAARWMSVDIVPPSPQPSPALREREFNSLSPETGRGLG